MSTTRRRTRRSDGRRAALPSAGWIDISVPVRTNMAHWPGDPDVRIERTQSIARGAPCNVSKLTMSAHTGTHMDAALHFVPGGTPLDAMPLSATIGPARVLEIRAAEAVHVAELHGQRIRRGERVLLKTRNSARCWEQDEFVEDFVYIAEDAAQYLAARRVRTVGVDYLSVGGYRRDGYETHVALLRAGIWIIEGLNLSGVRAGSYELICLPLRMEGADGGPARAILRKGAR
jgi:arylformamidase